MSDKTTMKHPSDIPVVEEIPENAYAVTEVDGNLKRIPAGQLGGGVKTAIIKQSTYDDMIQQMLGSGAGPMSDDYTFECLNMTFEEAYELMEAGQPLLGLAMVASEGTMCVELMMAFAGTVLGVPCIAMMNGTIGLTLYWTADGFSTSKPSTDV